MRPFDEADTRALPLRASGPDTIARMQRLRISLSCCALALSCGALLGQAVSRTGSAPRVGLSLPFYYLVEPRPSSYLKGNALGPILRPKGPVRRVTWYELGLVPGSDPIEEWDRAWQRSIVLEYDGRGNQTSWEDWFVDERVKWGEYEWSEAGKLVAERSFRREAGHWERRYQYDERGLLIGMETGTLGAPASCTRSFCEYDEAGR